jgi:uncharacterized protein (TIGR03067 family)
MLALILALIAEAPVLAQSKDEPARKTDSTEAEELKKWQGEWTRISCSFLTIDGKDIGKDIPITKMIVHGNTYDYTGKGDGKGPPHSLSLNAKEYPRQFDATYEATFAEWCAGRRGRQFVHGIYKIHGDRLTMCYVYAPRRRPRDFNDDESNLRAGVWVEVYERKKSEKKMDSVNKHGEQGAAAVRPRD